ncbi:MAG: CPBP family intramembrane metalloprotease [Muribaculaceae bacterium]|nr:CPBP family intramembrane metalloprotease [Muribaculaceae bacterium]
MKNFIAICQSVLVLFGFMLCGLFFTGVLGQLPAVTPGSLSGQWLVFAAQNVLAFIIPALITWRICFKANPGMAIGADFYPQLRMLLIAIAVYAAAVPALNQIVYWNQEIHLPESLHSFELWCREMESMAEEQTRGLLASGSIGVMMMNILTIGVLTGIGEEFFFRGGLQRMLAVCGVNVHVAVWTAAFVFSALHFQFFGFVPRLLLGVWFGYLYVWSGNIWVNSFAHALNNSLVIISAWLINRGVLSEDFDMWGVTPGAFPVIPLISAVLVAVLIVCLSSRGYISMSAGNNASQFKSSSNASEN